MRRQYHSPQDVADHMNELISQKIPFRTTQDGQSGIVLPLKMSEISGNLKCAIIKYPNGEDAKGQIGYCDREDFQVSDWEPVDLPESEWKQYLPKDA